MASGCGLSQGKSPAAHSEGRGLHDYKGHRFLLRKHERHE